ncbi:hypothetical protein FGIG_06219 [Fasciola gigantica]|uniref:Uncharacterized protein n=1 Tax=Fasciola gigantica TaxID=46835 RepID=A0A504YWH8_FASGI|nr:hypothetical protein FGIG_06219 [Fasciola gigantica]
MEITNNLLEFENKTGRICPNYQPTDHGFWNLLATKDKQICKELWKKFEDAATSLSAAISLTKAIQANGYIIRLLDSAKSQRIPPVWPHRMWSLRQYMNKKWDEIEKTIAELRSKSPNVVD